MRKLGGSDVEVSPVIFGAWAVGGWMWGGAEESESIAAIQASIDHGVTTIDTAAVYGQGYGEEVVGKAIRGRRDKVQVATKCGMTWDLPGGSDPWATKDRLGHDVTIRRNSSPATIPVECERSLKRLGVDAIDLYQVHWPDTTTPVEDTMAALVKLQDQGKIRAIGVSNYDADLDQGGPPPPAPSPACSLLTAWSSARSRRRSCRPAASTGSPSSFIPPSNAAC